MTTGHVIFYGGIVGLMVCVCISIVLTFYFKKKKREVLREFDQEY